VVEPRVDSEGVLVWTGDVVEPCVDGERVIVGLVTWLSHV